MSEEAVANEEQGQGQNEPLPHCACATMAPAYSEVEPIRVGEREARRRSGPYSLLKKEGEKGKLCDKGPSSAEIRGQPGSEFENPRMPPPAKALSLA
jgi:hypothetical protein